MLRSILLGSAFLAISNGAVQAQSGRTLLKVNMVRGYVDVWVNGSKVGRYGKAGTLDQSGQGLISRNIHALVKPGRNILRVKWSEKRFPIGEIHVSYAASSGAGSAFRELTSVDLGVTTQKSGDRSTTFNLPNARGGLQSNANTAGQRGRIAQGASRRNQTVLVASVVRGDIAVWVNNHSIGNYTVGYHRIDVSNYVRGANNQLRIQKRGNAQPLGKISVAYAPRTNAFRTVGSFDLNVLSQRSALQSPVAFRLPVHADR